MFIIPCANNIFLFVKNHPKIRTKWKALLFLFFSVLTNNAFPQGYNFRNFNSEDGLPQSFIYSIVQDTYGYLWVGTGNGLSKYNGFKFENFTTNDSLADNFITCGISAGKCLWFGHMNGQLSYFNGKKFHIKGQANLSQITHIAKNVDGQIWASTYSDGFLKLGEKEGGIKPYSFKNQTQIISFSFLNQNELLIGTNTGISYCKVKEPGEIEIIRTIAEIPQSKVMNIIKMRNKSGYFVATQTDGIYQLTYENHHFNVSKIITDLVFDFSPIQDIYEDSQSNIWLSTFGNGLVKLSYSAKEIFSKINYFNKGNGFITDNLKTVYEDFEGNIWSGNYGEGLTQITPNFFSVYQFDKNLYGNDIFSFFFNQFKWIGTEKGLIKTDQLSGKIIKFYGKGSGLPKDIITSIYSSDGKKLWIGTEKNGVYRMDIENEVIHKYSIGKGELENSINMITGKGDQVWVGTKKGLFNFNSVTRRIKWYSINQGGLPHNFINCLYIDNKNKLWVSTRSNILSYIEDEKVIKIVLNSGNGSFTLGPITGDNESRIWVGSNGNGIFMIGSDSVANITTNEGLLSNYCYSLICDADTNIWVSHKGGLSRIKSATFSVKPIRNIGNISDSYQFNQNAIIKDQQDKIWFGSDKGMICYDQTMDNTLLKPPALSITSIKINDEVTEYTDKIILSPGNYKIKFDFLGISLKEPSLVTYQYKLEGYDQWSEITKNTSVTYHNLSEGDYTFNLKASSGDAIVSNNPFIITITIKKPIWKKWWFYLIAILLLIIITFIYVKRREHKFLVEKNILEEKVRIRTYEIQCQKNEIESQKNLIDEKNTQIMSSIIYASYIQNAVLPPIELVNKLLPDSFILSKPKDIVSGDFYWLTEKDNKIIFTVADCTGHGVPGAFMSLLGITLLNEIVNIQGITRSDDVVTKLRESVIHSFKQNRTDSPISDGMDIALCVLEQLQQTIQYTGGMNDLVYIRDGKLEIVKSDRFSVCFSNIQNSFTMKEIDYRKGDVFYLFSDGFQDQFGGDHDKKYLTRRFYSTLLEIHEMNMINQKAILEKKLNEWMKNNIQTDDIIVVGIRI